MHKIFQSVKEGWHNRIYVGCCDSSKNKHGTKHFKDTGHPVIKSFEPGENWEWCYVDEIFKK